METCPGRLHSALESTLEARGYRVLTPVQRAVLSAEARDRDLLVSAPTGSGKTVAFGLAVADQLVATDRSFVPLPVPQALVIVPTRELARQVGGELAWLLAGLGARVGWCTGGTDPRAERAALARGLDVVVGSAGRLRDHVARRALVLERIGCVVLDEADDMLSRGFRADLEFILDGVPRGRRTLMFSATITTAVERLAGRYQSGAHRVDLSAGPRLRAVQGVIVAARERETVVANVLRWHEARSALVFCARRDAVARLAGRLIERGFGAVQLSGALTQRERDDAMASIRDGRARVCVASDVAARGLHLPGLDLVVNADLPPSADVLVHRAGRSGREGSPGTVVLVVVPAERGRATQLADRAGMALEWVAAPEPEAIRRRYLERLLAECGAAKPAAPDEAAAIASLAAQAPELIAAALLRLWLATRPAG